MRKASIITVLGLVLFFSVRSLPSFEARRSPTLEEIRPLFVKNCYDCHSGQTHYPWFYRLPLVQGFIDREIEKARHSLDMTEDFLSSRPQEAFKQLDQLERVIVADSMPPMDYLFLNWNKKLTAAEKKRMLDWVHGERRRLRKEDQTTLNKAEPIKPLPLQMDLNPKTVSLGDRLFHDPQLSRDKTISCARCHSLDEGGDDNRPLPIGMSGQLGKVNSPTVFNSGFNFKQFWDGRADTLEDQIDGPLSNPNEMGLDWDTLLTRLEKDHQYVAAFQDIYPDGVTKDNVKNAIATFERSLITPNAPFDRYLRGDSTAITDHQRKGYQLFKDYGCVSCHQGVNVGGNLFEKFGVFGDYFSDRGQVTPSDYGRFNVTGRERDRFKFKVPSLRNAEHTAPYFHDGSAPSLSEAVKIMARYQLGRDLPPSDVASLVAFIESLTGEYPGSSQ